MRFSSEVNVPAIEGEGQRFEGLRRATRQKEQMIMSGFTGTLRRVLAVGLLTLGSSATVWAQVENGCNDVIGAPEIGVGLARSILAVVFGGMLVLSDRRARR